MPCENTVQICEHHLIETDRIPRKARIWLQPGKISLKEEDCSVMVQSTEVLNLPTSKILSMEEGLSLLEERP